MKLLIIFFLAFACWNCTAKKNTIAIYTLYRNSVVDPSMRIHVATFNADESVNYNQENCFDSTKLYMQQEGVRTKFWCEKGNFKK